MNTTAAAAPRRVGVFGGAFDPPHTAHVALAQAALSQLELDELRIIPTGHAGHKSRLLTPTEHRLNMVGIAFGGLPHAVIDPREMERSGPSYTVDTMLELCAEQPHATFFLIMGQDQAEVFTSWHRWETLAQLAIICVANRPGATSEKGHFDAFFAQLPGSRKLEMPTQDTSATAIRHHIAHHQSVESLVFEPVARYIAHHHLYQTA